MQLNGDEKTVVMVEGPLKVLAPWYLELQKSEMPPLFDAFERAEYATIQRLGHNLKGTGGSYGFPALSEMGASIEGAAERADRPAMRDLIQRLAHYLDRVECRPKG